jgi:hypothetical protein
VTGTDAALAAESACPRCGAAREPGDRYCLECGLALPAITGRLPALRRGWIRRVGWYPGDWVWVALLTFLVAVGGATAAIAVSKHREGARTTVVAPAPGVAVTEPSLAPPQTTTPAGDTSTLPAAPEPTSTAVASARITWPADQNGWTIVLVSYPKLGGRPSALRTAAKAAKAGLDQVGVIDSSRYASLQPGYFVVFTGVYGSKSDADAAVATARQAGFGGAYTRQIAR